MSFTNYIALVLSVSFSSLAILGMEQDFRAKREREEPIARDQEKKFKSQKGSIILANNPDQLLPVMISFDAAQSSPVLREMIKDAMDVEQSNNLDFSTTFSQLSESGREIACVEKLLLVLRNAFKQNIEELHNLLANEERLVNEEFCKNNFTLLFKVFTRYRGEGKFTRKTFQKLKDAINCLGLPALYYFFDVYLEKVWTSKKFFEIGLHEDLKPLIGQYILRRDQKEFLYNRELKVSNTVQINEIIYKGENEQVKLFKNELDLIIDYAK